jgi:hypothetical protein
MDKYNIFKFKYGKEKKDIFHYVKVGILLDVGLSLVSLIPGVQKKDAFNLIDNIQQKFGIDVLNDYIIKDEEYLGYRIDRVINEAIQDYEKEK